MDVDAQAQLSKGLYLDDKYIIKENGTLMLDENLVKIDIVQFKITHQMYKSYVNVAEAYLNSGYNLMVHTYTGCPAEEKLGKNENARIPFKELFDLYVKNVNQDDI